MQGFAASAWSRDAFSYTAFAFDADSVRAALAGRMRARRKKDDEEAQAIDESAAWVENLVARPAEKPRAIARRPNVFPKRPATSGIDLAFKAKRRRREDELLFLI